MTKSESYLSAYQLAWANLAVQFVAMAVESQRLTTLRMAALATGQVSVAEEMRVAFTERFSFWRESREIIAQAIWGRKRDLGLSTMLQLYRKKLRAGERRLQAGQTS